MHRRENCKPNGIGNPTSMMTAKHVTDCLVHFCTEDALSGLLLIRVFRRLMDVG